MSAGWEEVGGSKPPKELGERRLGRGWREQTSGGGELAERLGGGLLGGMR